MTRDELLAAYAAGRRDFSRATLSEANLSRANLSWANLSGAILSEANLSRADLSWANLSGATLYGVNLYRANLYRANLSGATLYGADLSGATLPPFATCPEIGAFVAYKKLRDGLIAELRVPEDAPRTSSLIGRKSRAAWVEVVAIFDGDMEVAEGFGRHDGTRYATGETVVADDWDDDIRVECTHGIHFFITLAEARAYT